MSTSKKTDMKKIYLILFLFVGLGAGLSSCKKDFLNLTPLDQISDPEFWKPDQDGLAGAVQARAHAHALRRLADLVM
jgi:hypothetical protein